MVTENSKIADNTIYREYMYTGNHLVFAYKKNTYDNNVERRLYKRNGKMVKYTENNMDKKYSKTEDPIAMLNKMSAEMQKIFDTLTNRD